MYNLKEALLAKCYIEVLGLERHSEAAQHLIKWKQPVDGLVSSRRGSADAPGRRWRGRRLCPCLLQSDFRAVNIGGGQAVSGGCKHSS